MLCDKNQGRVCGADVNMSGFNSLGNVSEVNWDGCMCCFGLFQMYLCCHCMFGGLMLRHVFKCNGVGDKCLW